MRISNLKLLLTCQCKWKHLKVYDVASTVENILLIENIPCGNFIRRMLGICLVLVCKCLAIFNDSPTGSSSCRN